ncbi:MAG: hypothetical protein ACFB9M_05185 [Myxococcota bacterium]
MKPMDWSTVFGLGMVLVYGVVSGARPAEAQEPDEPWQDLSEFEGPEDEADPEPPEGSIRNESSDGVQREEVPGPPPRPRLMPDVQRVPDTGAVSRPPPVRTAPVEWVTEASIGEAMQRRSDALLRADTDAAELALQELVEVKRSLGLRNVVVAAAWVLRQARQELEADHSERALELSAIAAQLAPDLPAAHWSMLYAQAKHDPTQVVQIASSFGSLASAWMLSFRNAVTLGTWAGMVLVAALAVVGVAFGAVQLFKYVRYPAHDISRRLPGVLGTGELTLVLLVIVFLPAALGFGPWGSVLLGLAVVAPYQAGRERLLSGLVAVGLALSPVLLGAAAPFILFHGSDTDVIAAALQEPLSTEARERLSALSDDDDPESRLVHALVQAHRARQRGEIQVARQFYARVLQMSPDDHRSRNNAAVLAFVSGQQAEARAAFEVAIQSELAEPRLNLSLLLADDGQFERADALLMEARELSPELTAAFTEEDTSRPTGARLLEVPLEDSILWARLIRVDETAEEALVRALWTPTGGITPIRYVPFLVVGLFVLVLLGLRVKAALSTACTRCARPAVRESSKPLCEQCRSVFVTAVAVEPRLRAEKEEEVRSFQRRRRWLERIFAPIGIGLIVGDRPLRGFILAFVVTFSFLAVMMLPLLSNSSWHVYAGEEPRQAITYLLALVGLVAAGVGLQQSLER